ncbi:hypothetical protein ACT4Y6_16985 [Acinetobacter baumannii]|uniref:hypothetical protein n=1 Tax=Acinetobacter baumannii TaxID=470 RepID=UPI00227740CE|nr:hypothetical protein [Acinetobacter baumannii]MCY3369051.1 hypothetical protein [Acinetobacter baumannii]MDC4857799.1 hypothetical protein [Acinetobacter baumannii]MDC5222974.1 hypothetical protein [Acinetobacter baumannii]HCW3752708.1 hypothetical protein [Acinetobacter baumannii]
MKAEKRRRKVYYKSVNMPDSKHNLQTLLERALSTGALHYLAKDRHQLINSDSKDFILLNHHTNFQGMFFGQLVFVEYDKSQTYLRLDETTQEYQIEPLDIKSIQPKDEESEELKNQFINSILYFGVFENHLVLMQSPSLKSNHLEDYLKWLLSNASLLDVTSVLALCDTINKESQEKMKKNPAKSLKIGAPIEACLDESKHNSKVIEQAKSASFNLTGKGIEILKTVLGQDKLKDLRLEDGLDASNLKMYVVMTYDRKTTESGQKVIDTVATALRHLPDDDYQIELKNGGTIKAGELRISSNLSVEILNGTVNETNLWSQMHAWLMSNLKPNG